jgi:ubiquinone/menaquinone biosynthesis C-methylase UbiE
MRSSNNKNNSFVQVPEYAIHFGIYRNLLAKLLRHDPEMFDLDKRNKIVDVGCGYGDLLKKLRDRSYKHLIGIEPDDLCRKSCIKDGLDVRKGVIGKTGLPKNFADVVIVSQVFHHIDKYDEAVAELSRILKPGGIMCFLEPSPTLLRRLMDVVTFYTILPKWIGPINTRYEVMKLEMETGMYPYFLDNQSLFREALKRYFVKIWHRQGLFFQFGKYRKK